MNDDRQIIVQKGALAAQRIMTGYSEENYRAKVNAVYNQLQQTQRRDVVNHPARMETPKNL
jgi:hypothetical protein